MHFNGRRTTRRAAGRRVRPADLDHLTDEEILDLRVCDIDLKIEGTILEERIDRLYWELENRGISVFPHCWLSEEWFSPDGVPGIAVPFYMAHPRLMRLERKFMLEVEGGTEDWCLKILRHEAGHAIDTSYRIRRRQRFREVFGRASQPYPDYYQPKPYSRSFVLHLDLWYAQAHPVEDFAETFAVWLRPHSRWRSQYEDWPALAKLEYVDELMRELRNQKPPVRSREHVDPIRDLKKTLREHYDSKREHYQIGQPQVYDRELRRLFTGDPRDTNLLPAASFFRRHRKELRRVVSDWTGEYQYTIDQVLDEMIRRARDMRLRVGGAERDVLRNAMVMITVQTMNYLHDGHHRLAM